MMSDLVDFFHHPGRSELERRLSIVSSQPESNPEDISDLLECPICLEKCENETFVCRHGHLICGACKALGKVKLCPICRSQNLQRLSQFSQIVKKFESFPCSNGCGNLFPDKHRLAEHVEICITKWRKCPVKSCGESGLELDLRRHLILQHPEMCYAYGVKLSVGLGQMPEISVAFLVGLESTIVLQFQQNNGFGCSAFYLEPSNENLFVKLIFRNDMKKNSIKRILIPVFKKPSNEGFISSYRDMTDFVQTKSDGSLTLAVNMSISKVPPSHEKQNPDCHHDHKRYFVICPNFDCNELVHCPTCHEKNVNGHILDLNQLREVICHKCHFTQRPSIKCISCRSALVLDQY